ncbi:MAG: radical SAM protein, partial [archaeon]
CLDAINIDLKSMNPQFYLKTCRARLEPVLENIRRMHEAGIWVELTTLIIPNENDSAEELKKAAEFIASIDRSIPWHLTAFHPDYKMRDREATKTKKLFEAHKIAKDAGIEFAYTGNVSDSERQSTYCPKCSSLLVKRNWSHSEVVGMEKGKCADCGNGIPGVWE